MDTDAEQDAVTHDQVPTDTAPQDTTLKDRVWQFLKEDGLTIAVVLALVIAYLVLRTPGDRFGSIGEVEAQLAGGRPTVIEFYSNTCSICLASKPKVDQLERDIAEQAELWRLNVKDDVGEALAYRWQVTGVPTFFIFDDQGEIAYRQAGAPDVDAIRATVAELSDSLN
ncbi:MAG: TlpA family protein disulfide reductase [Anaerolineae bacterium]